VKFGGKAFKLTGNTAEVSEMNHENLLKMDLDREMNRFEPDQSPENSRLGSKMGFMHSRNGSQMSSINRAVSRGVDLDADDESHMIALARARTRSTANTIEHIPKSENQYSTPQWTRKHFDKNF